MHIIYYYVPLHMLFQVSYYVAEFWNTVSNVFIFAPPIFGIADALYQVGTRFNFEFQILFYLQICIKNIIIT